MKTLKMSLIAVAATAVMIPVHAEGLTYSVGVFTSNADFAEAKDFKPALKLGADYDFGNGFYAGAGFNTGKFEEQIKARGELILSVGYGNELSSGVFYDINATRYVYTKSTGSFNELGFTLGYGPVAVTYFKGFEDGSFVAKSDSVWASYTHSFNEKTEAILTVKQVRDEDTDKWASTLDYELGFAYDLGNNLTASATINKDKPKLVLGLTKSF